MQNLQRFSLLLLAQLLAVCVTIGNAAQADQATVVIGDTAAGPTPFIASVALKVTPAAELTSVRFRSRRNPAR